MKSFVSSYLIYSIPVLLCSEYIFWITQFNNKCRNFPLIKAILIDIFFHWLPVLLFLFYYSSPSINLWGLISIPILLLIYLIINMKHVNNVYDTDILLLAYIFFMGSFISYLFLKIKYKKLILFD